MARERHLASDNLKTHFSPGPVYFVKDEITRFGKDGTAKYTQQGRRKEINSFKPPGPGRYENHKCHPQGKKFCFEIIKLRSYSRNVFTRPYAEDNLPVQCSPKTLFSILGETHSPKYSMGSRTKYRRCDAFPSANSYSLPPLIGPRIPSKQASNAYRYR